METKLTLTITELRELFIAGSDFGDWSLRDDMNEADEVEEPADFGDALETITGHTL